MRRLISRGELGSRRLVMLIFAGYPLCGRTYPAFFNSPQPLSNSLGDACSGLDFPPSLNANESSWIGYRDPAASEPLLLWVGFFLVCVCFLPFGLMPLFYRVQIVTEHAALAHFPFAPFRSLPTVAGLPPY